MGKLIGFALILALIGLAIFMLLPGSPFLPGNNPETARATAQADYLARSEPLDGDQYVAVHGMDTIAGVSNHDSDNMVKVVVSGDASQTALGLYICASAWAFPAGILGLLGLLVFWLMFAQKNEQPKERS